MNLASYLIGLGFNFKSEFRLLDMAVISSAIRDLQNPNPKKLSLVKEAALYLFADDKKSDETRRLPFNTICYRNDVDPNFAAKAFWKDLLKDRQRESVRLALYAARFRVRFPYPPPIQGQTKLKRLAPSRNRLLGPAIH
jgi:hypothetical protein